MREHTWLDGGFVYLAQDRRDVDDSPSILWGPSGGRPSLPHNAPSGSVQEMALARQILRLAERVRELEAEVETELKGQVDISTSAGRAGDKAAAHIAALEEENRRLKDEARLGVVLREYLDWSLAQFPHSTPASVAAHIRKEAGELRDAPDSAEELADLLALVVHSAARQGIDLASTLAEKLPRLRARAWQAPDADGVVEHVRSERTDLRGYVVWHRHDGDLVKLVHVSEAEEVSGVISVSFDPGQPS